MDASMFYQRQLKQKIARYEREITIRKREIADIERRLQNETTPKALLERTKKNLEQQNNYAEIQIKKLKRQCFL